MHDELFLASSAKAPWPMMTSTMCTAPTNSSGSKRCAELNVWLNFEATARFSKIQQDLLIDRIFPMTQFEMTLDHSANTDVSPSALYKALPESVVYATRSKQFFSRLFSPNAQNDHNTNECRWRLSYFPTTTPSCISC